jgi:hypothetical protein
MKKCAGHLAYMGEVKNTYKILVGKHARKRPRRRPRRRWEDNININIKYIRLKCEDVDWIHLAQGMFLKRDLTNMVMNLLVT